MLRVQIVAAVISCGLLLPPALQAQQGRLRFEQLHQDDGLTNDRVLHIIQDSKGFMWFGTHSYDKHTEKVMPLAKEGG